MLPFWSIVKGMQCRYLRILPRYYLSSTLKNTISSIQTAVLVESTLQDQDGSASGTSNTVSANINQGEVPKTIKLSPIAQRAVWASKVIRTIKQANPSQNIQQSLRDLVISVEIDTKKLKFDLDPQHKIQILKMFNEGVYADQVVFNQKRVTHARIDNLVTFFPTISISKQIFHSMIQSPSLILMGTSGIGKTMSIILFVLLSDEVNKLKYLAHATWVDPKKRQQYLLQMNMLKQLQLIQNTPKCWYWSFRKNLMQTDKDVKKIILNQTMSLFFPQSIQQKLVSCESLIQMIEIIQSYQQQVRRFISTKVVLDQANAVTRIFRKWNNAFLQNISLGMTAKQAQQALPPSLKEYYFYSRRIKIMIQNFLRLGISYILNSSQMLELDLLKPPQETQKFETLYLDFADHGEPSQLKISYANNLQSPSTRIEFCQFFLFILELYAKYYCVKKEIIEKIKNNFNVQKFKIKSHYRILYIYEYFQKQKKTEYFRNLQSLGDKDDKQIQKYTENQYIAFDKFCLEQNITKLKHFCNKDSSTKQFKILMLRMLQLEAFQNLIDKKQKFTVKIQKIQKVIRKYKELTYFVQLPKKQRLQKYAQMDKVADLLMNKQYFNSHMHNRQLFPCKFTSIQEDQMEFDWLPQDLLEIVYPTVYENNIISNPSQKLLQNIYAAIFRYISTKGNIIEGFWIKFLASSQAISFEIYKSSPYINQIIEKNRYQIEGEQTFLPLDERCNMSKEKKDQSKSSDQTQKAESIYIGSFPHNLAKILESASKKPNKIYLGVPQFESPNEQKPAKNDTNSTGIDFIFVKFSEEEKIFDITTFDLKTTKKTEIQIDIALELLQKALANSKSIGKDQFRIKYAIICPYRYCEESETKQNIQIEYYPIESLEWIGYKNYTVYCDYNKMFEISLLKE